MEAQKYKCEECGEAFKNELDWEQHSRQVHARYTCPDCPETFNAEQEFEDHHSRTHRERQSLPR